MKYNSYTDFYLQELFPSAIMFGMSSEDFWENDPKLYWAYRTFYLKQKEIEIEQLRYNAWLQGSMNYMGVSMALNNAFSKQKLKYPSYDELTKEVDSKKEEKLSQKDINEIAQEQFNYWARK